MVTMEVVGFDLNIAIRTALAKRPMGRRELNFKFYRQSTNKIVGISDRAASFLSKCF